MKTLKEKMTEFVLDDPKFTLVSCLIACIVFTVGGMTGFTIFMISPVFELVILIIASLNIFFLIVFFLFFLFALNTIISDYENYNPPKIID